AGPAALVLAIPSPRASAPGRILVPRILLALYAITLLFGGPLPWTLLKGSVCLALAVLSALAACAAIWWSSLRHSRRIAFGADAVTWAALLWISIGPLAGLHFGKAAETAVTSVTLNLIIPIGCIAAAIVLARRSSASTRPEGARAP